MNTESVDSYLQDGCGRCDQYRTPQCKVHLWTPILEGLRGLLRAAGLDEEMKWGSPCYTLDGKNVAMIVALKDHCALQFFKGTGLTDPDGLLTSPGPNSQYVRMLELRSMAEFTERRGAAEGFLAQAYEALTPGRRRSHVLHVSGAKQSDTRARRVDRCVPDILAGRGFNER